MMQYTHKPTVISAVQWTPSDDLLPGMVRRDDFLDRKNKSVLPRFDLSWHECAALIEGQQGWHMVKSGDYICRGLAGELYPVPPLIFEANYQLKENQPRKPFDEQGMQQHIGDTVQAEVDRAGE